MAPQRVTRSTAQRTYTAPEISSPTSALTDLPSSPPPASQIYTEAGSPGPTSPMSEHRTSEFNNSSTSSSQSSSPRGRRLDANSPSTLTSGTLLPPPPLQTAARTSTSKRRREDGDSPEPTPRDRKKKKTTRRYVSDERKGSILVQWSTCTRKAKIGIRHVFAYIVEQDVKPKPGEKPKKGKQSWRKALKEILVNSDSQWLDCVILDRLKRRAWAPVASELVGELKTLNENLNLPSPAPGTGRSDDDTVASAFQTSSSFPMRAAEDRRTAFLQSGEIQMIDELSRIQHAQTYAPSWCHILSTVLPKRHKPGSQLNTRWIGPFLASLAAKRFPKKGNKFGKLVGMYMWHAGLTRVGLQLLNRLGMIPSYSTINRSIKEVQRAHTQVLQSLRTTLNRVGGHDNFQVTQNVRQSTLGHENQHYDFTTAYIKESRWIPPTGIPQSKHDPYFPLQVRHIVGTKQQRIEQTRTNTQAYYHYIYRALQKLIPKLRTRNTTSQEDSPGYKYGPFVKNKQEFSTGLPDLQGRPVNVVPIERPTTPDTEFGVRRHRQHSRLRKKVPSLIPHSEHQSYTYALRILPFNEATEAGTADVMEDIYLTQLGIDVDNPQWKDNIFLHFGDGLTLQRLHGMKSHVHACNTDFDRCNWLLPVMGLWHLKYHYIDALIERHFGGPNDDTSSLYWSFGTVYTSRSMKKNNFEAMQSLVLSAFQSKLAALAIHEISNIDPNNYQLSQKTLQQSWLEDWFIGPGDAKLPLLFKNVVNDIWSTLNQDPDDSGVDVEFQNNIIFIANTLPYMILLDAIKYCDINLLRHAIRGILLVFSALEKRTVYQYELCRYYWLVCTNACEKDLQDIILRESMVNRSGRPNSYYPNDEYNELINGELRNAWNARKTTTQTPYEMLKRATQTTDFMWGLRLNFETAFSTKQNSTHAEADEMATLRVLVHALLTDTANGRSAGLIQCPGRTSPSRVDYLIRLGQRQLSKVVTKFNETRSRYLQGTVTSLQEVYVASLDPEPLFSTETIYEQGEEEQAPIENNEEGPIQDATSGEGITDIEELTADANLYFIPEIQNAVEINDITPSNELPANIILQQLEGDEASQFDVGDTIAQAVGVHQQSSELFPELHINEDANLDGYGVGYEAESSVGEDSEEENTDNDFPDPIEYLNDDDRGSDDYDSTNDISDDHEQ